jgi:SAM-dependent methyltransferase
MWDEKYATDKYVYGTKPNDFLVSMTNRLKKGRVLCLAEGEGRNAVHLAKAGFTAVAVDSSTVGLAKARKLAQNKGVSIETEVVDLNDFAMGEHCWDSIVSIFCHLPAHLRKQVHSSVVAGLKEGGTFLLEAYTPKQIEYGTGGPHTAEFMMDLETLFDELAGLKIVHGQETVRKVVEGIGHTGMASVVQILAEKIS